MFFYFRKAAGSAKPIRSSAGIKRYQRFRDLIGFCVISRFLPVNYQLSSVNLKHMHRKDFISTVGFSVAAVCTGCLAACSKSNSITAAPAPTGVNFDINLASELLNAGDSKQVSGVLVVRLSAGNTAASFTAVQVACTHEGTSINYNPSLNEFVCPLHGSIFTTSGAVVQGPAASPLKKYTIVITNTTLNVTG
jgi:cytochrome b6-f complex iron-sulfur subunit